MEPAREGTDDADDGVALLLGGGRPNERLEAFEIPGGVTPTRRQLSFQKLVLGGLDEGDHHRPVEYDGLDHEVGVGEARVREGLEAEHARAPVGLSARLLLLQERLVKERIAPKEDDEEVKVPDYFLYLRDLRDVLAEEVKHVDAAADEVQGRKGVFQVAKETRAQRRHRAGVVGDRGDEVLAVTHGGGELARVRRARLLARAEPAGCEVGREADLGERDVHDVAVASVLEAVDDGRLLPGELPHLRVDLFLRLLLHLVEMRRPQRFPSRHVLGVRRVERLDRPDKGPVLDDEEGYAADEEERGDVVGDGRDLSRVQSLELHLLERPLTLVRLTLCDRLGCLLQPAGERARPATGSTSVLPQIWRASSWRSTSCSTCRARPCSRRRHFGSSG